MQAIFTMNPEEQKLTLIIDWKNGDIGQKLSADEAEEVVKYLCTNTNDLNKEAFKQWLLQFESTADTLEIDGKTLRFKMVANKTFLTKFGHLTIPRRLYQADTGGPVYVPLDEAWSMHGQFAAVDVRESLLFMTALLSPCDIVACLEKIGSFPCSKTAIQNIIDEVGEDLAEYEDELLDIVRTEEELPLNETKAVAVSLDGVNVRLNTPGPKKGRPTERPKDEESMSRETASCYKNAMVGVIGFYGDVPKKEDQKDLGPERLAGHCVARMPENKFPTFREKLESEVQITLDRLPSDVVKIVLNDGGTNLWNYVDSNSLYDGFEKMIDFKHVLDHVSLGAEGIFGKATAEGQMWYRKMEGTLLSYEDGAE